MPTIDYETRGGGADLLIKMRGIREVLDHQIRDIIGRAADAAANQMTLHWEAAPHHGTREESIASSIGTTPPVFHPGGAGGGGYWEVHAGPGPDRPEHFEYVWRGTGIYGPTHMPYRSGTGQAMPVPGYGRGFAQHVAGQPPQQEWFAEAQRTAEAFVAEGIQRIRYEGQH